jgi:hypothetical protein
MKNNHIRHALVTISIFFLLFIRNYQAISQNIMLNRDSSLYDVGAKAYLPNITYLSLFT